MAKCLVLGANGFIGSHLVDSLSEAGYDVRAFDRYSQNKSLYDGNEKVEQFVGDFLNRHDLSTALEGIDYVFHFISTTTPITAEADPLIDVETNIKMSIVLFQECVRRKIKKVIFASTGGAIYGDAELEETGRFSEFTLPNPVSPYAIGKLSIENYLRYFHRKYDLQSVSYRISNPYGDRQSLNSKQGVIPIFLQHIIRKEPITVLGDGSMVRDYLYVKDVADMVAASFVDVRKPLYNLGSGNGYSVNEIVDIIKELESEKVDINYHPAPPTFAHHAVLDTTRFITDTGLVPQTEIHDGIKKTWYYIKKEMGEII